MKNAFTLLLLFAGTGLAYSQSVGIGTNSPAPSARLEISSNNQGFLPPRLTEAQRNSIASPVTGLVIFNTNTNCLNVFVGSGWQEIRSSTTYPYGTVFCGGSPTAIVDVLNPITGETWMDRNLGASRAATSSTDDQAFGDLYQWGRRADGHQCRNSNTTAVLSSTDQPSHGDFIVNSNFPNDWRTPANKNLWQGVFGTNNPCPSGYRLPTAAEMDAEVRSWSSRNAAGAFASPLKFTLAGSRLPFTGEVAFQNTNVYYWTSSTRPDDYPVTSVISISNTGATLTQDGNQSNAIPRGYGASVRCIKESNKLTATVTALNCGAAVSAGTLRQGEAASDVSSSVPYTGGNGGVVLLQQIPSTGVTGLTATIAYGNLANGDGALQLAIAGTPQGAGTASFALSVGGQSCTLTRTVEPPLPAVASLNCSSGSASGFLIEGNATNAGTTSSSIAYTGGNGAPFNQQSIPSTGVTGLTATLSAGSLANGDGTLQVSISGTPSGSGTASFPINLGGQSCTIERLVYAANANVSCSGQPTTVVEVLSPATGKTWMDRNLGATRAATSSADDQAYGDLYQWGRRADGHQCRQTDVTYTLSNTDKPLYSEFIISVYGNYDWRDPQNDNLWQGVSGVNNPCPTGFRVPTDAEWNAEIASWADKTTAGAFASPLKLTVAGGRNMLYGNFESAGSVGFYWTSNSSGNGLSNQVMVNSSSATVRSLWRAWGSSVRCIKN